MLAVAHVRRVIRGDQGLLTGILWKIRYDTGVTELHSRYAGCGFPIRLLVPTIKRVFSPPLPYSTTNKRTHKEQATGK